MAALTYVEEGTTLFVLGLKGLGGMMQTLKASGHVGSWFARIGDEDIPCVWLEWKSANHYCDPGVDAGRGKWPRYIEAIKAGKKVALTGKRNDADGKWRRDGYIGLFEVSNVAVTERGFEFEFVRRLAHLK